MKKTAQLVILMIISLVGFAGQLKAANKTGLNIPPTRLDPVHSLALWHSLTKTEVSEDELVNLFTQNSFSDEFDRRRQIAKAKRAYGKFLTDVVGENEFHVNVAAGLKGYDFNAKAYPVPLYEGAETFLLPLRNGVPAAEYAQYADGRNNFQSVTGSGIRIWYDIREELRSIEMDETAAEKIQPRLNEARSSVVMTLALRARSANNQDSNRNIFFETTGFVIKIPAVAPVVRNGAIVRPGKNAVILKSWVSGKNKGNQYLGPNMEGVWVGVAQYPERQAGGVVIEGPSRSDFVLNLKQSRSIITGTYRETYQGGANPLGNASNPKTTEQQVVGKMSEDGRFVLMDRFERAIILEGRANRGELSCAKKGVNFKMTH